MKYYSFSGSWPIFRKVDGKYYWLVDEGEWRHHSHADSSLVNPKELTSIDMQKIMNSQYRDGSEAKRVMKRIIFYQEVLWE